MVAPSDKPPGICVSKRSNAKITDTHLTKQLESVVTFHLSLAKWLTLLSAKQLIAGSNPARQSLTQVHGPTGGGNGL
jgi:hypothetical protein